MIEVLFSTAVSAALIASAALPIIASRRRETKNVKQDKDSNSNSKYRIPTETVNAMIKHGYAYSVDLGDSMVVVVVVEKKEAKSFLGVEEEPITFIGVEGVLELNEATA